MLARAVGAISETEHGSTESGSRETARRALELIVGEDALRSAVDHYVRLEPGAELARMVLWQLHPWSAMERCYEIAKTAPSVEERRAAVELLRVVADRRALPWVGELLGDDDAEVQIWATGVLDQLLWSELIEPEEAEDLLRAAEQHTNPSVPERAAFIRRFLADRSALDE